VRAATLAELERSGLSGLAMDRVAREAGVSRSTLYRRWPTRAALVADLVEPLLARYDEIEPGTDLVEDLFLLLTTIRDNSSSPAGKALFSALSEPSPDLAATLDRMTRRTLTCFERLIDAGVERDEIDSDEDTDLVVHLLFSAAVMWERNYGTQPSDEALRQLLHVVLHPRMTGHAGNEARPEPRETLTITPRSKHSP